MPETVKYNHYWGKLEFEYKGHNVYMDEDIEPEECIKKNYTVSCPDGETRYPDVSPYSDVTDAIKMWIDLGYPHRTGCCPLDVEDLQKIKAERHD